MTLCARTHRLSLTKDERLSEPNFPAIALLDDPQGFVERMFAALRRARDTCDQRTLATPRSLTHHWFA